MIKNNGCCDLEYAKKLKELGVKQESIFYYIDYVNSGCEIAFFPKGLKKGHIKKLEIHPTLEGQFYSAFTVAELGEMLPYYLVGKGELTIKKNYLRDKRTGWNVRYEKTINCKGEPLPTICGDIMANAMALMLIWLIENKMMEV